MEFRIKRGDTGPALVVGLSYSDGSSPNLAGATGRFIMSLRGATTPAIDEDVALDNTAKTATYTWQAADTDDAGTYQGEIEITFADGIVQTFPSQGFLAIVVEPDLD
jgi:hypothetical protein